MVVFDVNKRSSFESALSIILEHKKASSIDHVGSKMPIMLVGTKTDLYSFNSSSSSGTISQAFARGTEYYIPEEEQRNRAERYNVVLNVSKLHMC